MSGFVKVGIVIGKFGQEIGFKPGSRGVQRLELTSLLGQVAAHQPNPEAAKIVVTLNAALDKLEGKGDKKKLVEEANSVAQTAGEALKQLKKDAKAREEALKQQQPSKKERKAMKDVQEGLRKELDTVLKDMDPDLGTIKLKPEHQKSALLVEAESIRTEIGRGDPNEGTREDELRLDIGALKTRIGEANAAHQEEAKFLKKKVVDKLADAKKLLERFDAKAGGEYKGKLRDTVRVLESAITGQPADPGVARALIDEVTSIRRANRKDADYVKTTQAQATAVENSDELGRRFKTMIEPTLERLEALRNAQADGYGDLSKRLQTLRSAVGQPIEGNLTDATLDLREAVDALYDDVTAQFQQLEKSVADDAKLAQAALTTAKRQFDALHGAHGDASVLEADWKAIEAQLGSAEALVPANGAIPKTLSASDAKLAKSLAEQAAARLKTIKDETASLLTFDEDVKQLAKDLEGRSFWKKLKGNSKGVLEEYDPEGRTAFEEQLQELLKALPVTPAKSSIEAFKLVKQAAETAVDTLQPAVDYIDQTARPLFQKMNGLRIGWIMGSNGPGSGTVTKGPKAFDDALDALQAQMKLKPPVLASLQMACAAADLEFKKAEPYSGQQVKGVVDKDDAAEAKVRQENEKRRSVETKLLNLVERRYAAVEQAVKASGGDENALDAAKRLLDQIKADIEGNRFDKLMSKRKDLEGRVSLLLSNPMGEANRGRADFPAVMNELRSAIGDAVKNLQAVAGEIRRHPFTDDDDKDARDIAVSIFDAYVELLEERVDDLDRAAKPILKVGSASEDERRKAREEALRLLRAVRNRLQGQPMTSELLQAPFAGAKSAIAPVFRGLDKYEYTVTTCI